MVDVVHSRWAAIEEGLQDGFLDVPSHSKNCRSCRIYFLARSVYRSEWMYLPGNKLHDYDAKFPALPAFVRPLVRSFFRDGLLSHAFNLLIFILGMFGLVTVLLSCKAVIDSVFEQLSLVGGFRCFSAWE